MGALSFTLALPSAVSSSILRQKLLIDKEETVYYVFTNPQAAQTHVAREGCNAIYITYVTRAGVALQATVENIRDFVWEICH